MGDATVTRMMDESIKVVINGLGDATIILHQDNQEIEKRVVEGSQIL